MATMYSADELLAIAVQIEDNGAAFFRKAAALRSSGEESRLLLQLANEEVQHAQTFRQMRRELDMGPSAQDLGKLRDLDYFYIEAIADAHGGEGSIDAVEQLTASMSIVDILFMAIGFEQKSILFYLGMKDAVPPHMGQSIMDTIVSVEKGHIAQLQECLGKQRVNASG